MSRHGLGASLSQSLAHAGRCHESQRSLHLIVESCFGAFFGTFSACGDTSQFSPMPLSLGVSLSMARHSCDQPRRRRRPWELTSWSLA